MASSSSPLGKTAAVGILQSSLSPKYLHTNSTSHTWPFSAIAELIDNAYDPDVKASQLWIDEIRIHHAICLTFTDNGNGMQPDKLHKMLSFGFCEKVADGTHMPVGHYGNGFKSGSMRLGKDALVLTKQANSRSIGYLSQTYLETIKAETVVVPLATWDKKDNEYLLRPNGFNALKDIFCYSLVKSEKELNNEFDEISGEHGTRIIISNIRKTSDNKPEFDFDTDEHDIRIPDDTSSEGEKYRKTKRQNHVPECDYSLRAYCAILYLKPRMQIILRDKKVKTLVVEKSLSKTEVDRYKPTHHATTDPVKVVFGFNSRNKNHYGIMMYHRNRLIKPYERVGFQLKANNLGVGVVGVVQCDFLQPTHNKQDFDYTKAYRACIYSLGVKLNEYWNEKKGPVKSSTNSVIDQTIPEPQEVQSIPDQTWAQCDEPSCLKWRKLPDGIHPDSLPDKWFCHMNPDPNFKSCDVPEEKDDDQSNITPYAKVQKKRLVKEMEEKQRREKAAKIAEQREQEQKTKILEEREKSLKRKEELIKQQLTKLQANIQIVKTESLPTAQVAPRPTTKISNAVTPTAKPSPRQIGSQLAARISQSQARTPQTSQSTRSPAKLTSPPVTPLGRPSCQSNQTPRPLVGGQLATKHVLTNQSTRAIASSSQSPSSTANNQSLTNKAKPLKQNITLLARKPANMQALTNLASKGLTPKAGVTFKMVKAPNGTTYLVQEKKPPGTTTSTGTKPTPTVVRQSGTTLAAISALNTKSPTGTTTSQVKPIAPTKHAVISSPNSNVDIKPRLNVLPKPQQVPITKEAVGTPKPVSLARNATKSVAKSPVTADVKPSFSLAATAYSEITGNTSTTPQEVRNILGNGIKREAPENAVSPIPSKVPRRKSEAADVIVIDSLPSTETQRREKSPSESAAEKRAKELADRVKSLETVLSKLKSDGKDQMEKLAMQLSEKSAQLAKKDSEMKDKTDEIQTKTRELNEKSKQLKLLRGNVCKLLQVLVPEIDVLSDTDEAKVDDLLKQVLDANK
ncbi:MORC family CW-type zinc finger protein 3-like [Dendronephthya gigantea]|uniref:MORC family CW-type zinc finger protein 3-like n=1 Tax=Dendronephthya gigantea TaxID=151771 RepID=UPI00106A8B05|nr:MORC family CW-type zinc finger protein 3-like [Dendronephthya gigantea]